jgi:hypothetical protein
MDAEIDLMAIEPVNRNYDVVADVDGLIGASRDEQHAGLRWPVLGMGSILMSGNSE